MTTVPPAPLPLRQSISGVETSHGSQAVTGTVHGSVTLHSTYTASIPQPPPRPPKPTSTVPFRRDRDFVDRGDLLEQIDERCSQPAGRAALVGLGGVGKSQLAIEYAHRVRERSPETWVFWVFASNVARIEAAYKGIADKLGLPGRDEGAAKVVALVTSWLANEENGRWIMIVDNLDDISTLHAEVESSDGGQSVASLVPQSDNGAVLVTSRNIDVAREMVGREEDILRLGRMSEREADTLLRKKLAKRPDKGVEELLAAIEYFPIAITQAAAFINRQPGMTVSKYVRKLRDVESMAAMLAKSLPDARRHEKAVGSILKTWQVSFEQIQVERAGAADLLSYMCFFNRQGIPKFMLRHYKEPRESNVGEADKRLLEDDMVTDEDEDEELDEHIAMLHSFSLIDSTLHEDEFEMHGLVQMATRVWLQSKEEEALRWSRFLEAMAASYPRGEYENWPVCRALLPHVQSVMETRPSSFENGTAWVDVVRNAGWYAWRQGLLSQAAELIEASLSEAEHIFGQEGNGTLLSVSILASVLADQGKYEKAERMNRRALAGREEKLGEDHPETLTSVSNLALVLADQGKYEEAERMNRRALAGREEKLGEDHPGTLTSVSNLAGVLADQGKYEEAERMNRRALAGREEKLGEDHPDTLTSVSNLALVLGYQGKYEEAERMNRRALTGREEKLGEDHPDTLTSVSNLASVLADQGKYEEAERMNRRALAGREEKLGEDHPETLTSVSNLALVLADQGKYEEAERMNRRALAGREEKLGEDHPGTLTSVSNLAGVLADQGKYEEAERMNRRALAGREEKLGEDHPDTLTSVSNLALVLGYQGKYEEAERMNRRALTGREEKLGEDHPDTLTSVSNLASVLGYQGKYEEAERMNRRALAGREEKLGADHPDTLTSVSNLAGVLQYQGKYGEAERMNRRALAGREEKLGKDHPDTLTSMSNLAGVLQVQGKYEEAERMNRRALAGREEKLGEDHPGTLTSVDNLAGVLRYQGKYEEAERMNRRALAGREKKLGDDHP